MFVSEKRVLGVGLGAAQVRLANLVHDGWLSGASDCAYWGGMDHLLRAGPLGDLPVLDADIKLSAEGGQGTRVALTGCYRPPFGALGAGLDRMLMHTVATLTLRSLLTRLATALEGTAAAAGEKPVFWQRDTGPQTASD